MIKKILKTEIVDCKRCIHSCWLPGEDKWRLRCSLFDMIISTKGQEHPIPEQCKLDDVEELLKGRYEILEGGEIRAILLAPDVESLNDPEFLKKVIDVLERRYFKLKDLNDGLKVQVTLEEDGRVTDEEEK